MFQRKMLESTGDCCSWVLYYIRISDATRASFLSGLLRVIIQNL
ncbi:hypothetical protein HanPI659440_Chr03g0100461 [Helianthus annuus]|nr:hypothetical protein HanPI659440_Chr03g0100461 [Helianthus annuus]